MAETFRASLFNADGMSAAERAHLERQFELEIVKRLGSHEAAVDLARRYWRDVHRELDRGGNTEGRPSEAQAQLEVLEAEVAHLIWAGRSKPEGAFFDLDLVDGVGDEAPVH